MTILREVALTDADAIATLMTGAGWGASSRSDWERLWVDNPAVHSHDTAVSRGWVLEDGERTVGFLCNIEQGYQLGARPLRAAVAAALVVLPEFRGESMRLVLAYARQDGVDLLLTNTAAPQTTKIFEFLKFDRMPQPDYDMTLFWVLRPAGFLGAAFRKKGLPWAISRMTGVALGPILWSGIRALGRHPRRSRKAVETKVIAGNEINADFDDLWQRKIAEAPRLFAHRTSSALRWHFTRPGARHPPFLACAYRGRRLTGYLAVVRQDADHLGLRRARIADLFVEGDDADTILQLVQTAAEEARRGGADMVEFVGFPERVRNVVKAYRPFERQEQNWPYLFKARHRDLHAEIASPDVWYASLFDGDGSL